MNSRINRIIKKILLEIEQKQLIGKGLEHEVYPFLKKNDKVVKVGRKETIDEWYQIFLDHPEYFAKVYKRSSLKNSENFEYVIIERLNTETLEMDWRRMDDEIFNIIEGSKQGYKDFTDLYYTYGFDSNIMKNVYKRLTPKSKSFYRKISNLILKIEPMVGGTVDANIGNFGYDENANIKCLDV